jgi:hypothetical protein
MVQQTQPLLIWMICSFDVGHEDVVVDVLFAELVLDDRDLLAVGLGQDALEQRGFARAEKAGQDGRGNEGHGECSGCGKQEMGEKAGIGRQFSQCH